MPVDSQGHWPCPARQAGLPCCRTLAARPAATNAFRAQRRSPPTPRNRHTGRTTAPSSGTSAAATSPLGDPSPPTSALPALRTEPRQGRGGEKRSRPRQGVASEGCLFKLRAPRQGARNPPGRISPPRRANQHLPRGGPQAHSVSNSASEQGACPIGRQKRTRVPLEPRLRGRGRRLPLLAVGRREPPVRDVSAGVGDWLRSGAKRNAGKPGVRPGVWERRGGGGGGSSSGIAGTGTASGVGAASERCGKAAAASVRPLLWPGAAADFADPIGGGRAGKEGTEIPPGAAVPGDERLRWARAVAAGPHGTLSTSFPIPGRGVRQRA